MGMPPPGQPIGQQTVQPTIVLGRPGQPGSSAVQVNAAGGQIVRQQFVQPGGIRVQGKELKKKFLAAIIVTFKRAYQMCSHLRCS